MADITGRVYEAFTEFILRRLNYRDEWTEGRGRQYLFEKGLEAYCYRSIKICPVADQCREMSTKYKIPYGPWYDPDFFIVEGDRPVGCLQVTHWSSASNSPFKFWRTIEDYFQHKLFFGQNFLSINFVFEALEEGSKEQAITDTNNLINLHGWKPAVGTVLVSSFDATFLFPRYYEPLKLFAEHLPAGPHGGGRKRRELYNKTWESLYEVNSVVRQSINRVVRFCAQAFASPPHPRYSKRALEHLRRVCFSGRSKVLNIHPSESFYRIGLQHAFILREMILRSWGGLSDPDEALWQILQSNPRFPKFKLRELLNLPLTVPDRDINKFISLLESIPVRIAKSQMQPLLIGDAGIEHVSWNPDLSRFILGLRHLDSSVINEFREAVNNLFETYANKYGIKYVLYDLHDPIVVRRKVDYVAQHYVDINNKGQFIRTFEIDMLTPGKSQPHQKVAKDIHNWPLYLLLLFYNLGTFQHLTACLSTSFERKYHHSLRYYAFKGNLDQLLNHLLAGVPVGQFFSKKAPLSEEDFYMSVWPLIGECLWKEIQTRKPLSIEQVEFLYRYKKAMRIIASPDLKPIDFLVHTSLPNLQGPSIVRSAFNQLSSARGWSRTALTTEAEGFDPIARATIHAQSVFGRKHIADKTRELAARARSMHIRYNAENDTFEPETNPVIPYLVVDGDWPVESKINLYEAGFNGIYEIAELDRLSDELQSTKGKT